MTIDAQAEKAKAEIHAMAQQARDVIAVKVGFWIRSDSQKRRYERAKKKERAK